MTGGQAMAMEVTGNSGHQFLPPVSSGPGFRLLNPPRAKAFNWLAACRAVPQACPWGGETEPPGPWGHPHLRLPQSSSALSRVLRALSIGKKVLQSKQFLKISALRDKCPCQAKWPSPVYPGDIQGDLDAVNSGMGETGG